MHHHPIPCVCLLLSQSRPACKHPTTMVLTGMLLCVWPPNRLQDLLWNVSDSFSSLLWLPCHTPTSGPPPMVKLMSHDFNHVIYKQLCCHTCTTSNPGQLPSTHKTVILYFIHPNWALAAHFLFFSFIFLIFDLFDWDLFAPAIFAFWMHLWILFKGT